MRIGSDERAGGAARGATARPTRLRRWAPVLAGGALVLVLLAAGAGLHAFALRHGLVERARGVAGNLATFVEARWRAEPERLHLDIAHKKWLRIVAKREQALAEGVLVSSPDDFVSASIRHGAQSIPVEVRLKGDFADHWAGDKWSFRVRVKGDHTLLGMKQFSLQHPGTRGYMAEWLLHEALRREGLPALRYDFVELSLNGRDLGVHAIEEHFDKRLIEHSERREGPIVRFDEDLCFAEIRAGQGLPCAFTGSGSYLAAEADAFQTNRLRALPASAAQLARATGLLDAFRRGELPTSQVFDVPLLARYFAVLERLGALHAAGWRNARFYFNPITTRLEPIGFDAGAPAPGPVVLAPLRSAVEHPLRDNLYFYHYAWFDRLFADEDFYRAYVRELDRVSRPQWLEGVIADAAPRLDAALATLQTEFPWQTLPERRYATIGKGIRAALHPQQALRARLESRDADGVTLRVGNLQYLPLELIGLAGAPPLSAPLLLPGRRADRPVEWVRVRLPAPVAAEGEGEAAQLVLRHRVLGLDGEQARAVGAAEPDLHEALRHDVTRMAPNAKQRPFIAVDEAARELRIRPGHWRVEGDLVVPAGYRLRAGPGTVLELMDGALLLSRSPLEWQGRADAPVVVRAGAGHGQAVLVMAAGEPSRLQHVHFEGLEEPVRAGWNVTGAVTFYESPVALRDVRLSGGRAEDALNLVRSPFEMERTLFTDAAGDAFDADFSSGTLRDVVFVRPGNDAVDISGSVVTIDGLRVSGAGDKGLSAGERSRVEGDRIRIRGAALGVASKDRSVATLRDVEIHDARIGFAAFQKKSEFGGARLDVSGLSLDGVEAPFLVERGSRMVLDGRPLPADDEAVGRRLYGDR